jgi:hypothetical protein
MTAPPSDRASLAVPLHLDAWVWDEDAQQPLSRFLPDYMQLGELRSAMPDAFKTGQLGDDPGVHLHWALPDALTHGARKHADESHPGSPQDPDPITFPAVPDRWLIVRLAAEGAGIPRCTVWVVHSDWWQHDPDGTVAQGPSGSAFVDPHSPPEVPAGMPLKLPQVKLATLGKTYTLEEWEATTDAGGPTFLRAVGPGNVAFAAYEPFVRDVFSFVDRDVLKVDHATFSYLIAGWHADRLDDPMASVDPGNPSRTLAAVLAELGWAIPGFDPDHPPQPPDGTVYHATVLGVRWPASAPPSGGVDTGQVRVAIGNTAVDAFAALIEAEALALGKGDSKWQAAGASLAELVEAAMHDALGHYGAPGGSARIAQRIHEASFGSAPAGTLWNVVASVPADAAQEAAPPALSDAQATAIATALAELNVAQRTADQTALALASSQQALYAAWLKLGGANAWTGPKPPPWTLAEDPDGDGWKAFKKALARLYPALVASVGAAVNDLDQARAKLPNPADPDKATAWADDNWKDTLLKAMAPAPEGSGKPLTALGLALKPSPRPGFWHPTDPVLLVSAVGRTDKHGADGTLRCRLGPQRLTGFKLTDGSEVNLASTPAAAAPALLGGAHPTIPDVAGLLFESYLADPANTAQIASATGHNQAAVAAAIRDRNSWLGTPPPPFALGPWVQAWSPLFLEWQVQYHSSTGGASPLAGWTFDGEQYSWNGTGVEPTPLTYAGRALLTPQLPDLFLSKVAGTLTAKLGEDAQEIADAISTWDLLSATLSGLGDQLVTRATSEAFPPPPGLAKVVGARRQPPKPDGARFLPVRGGLLRIEKLQVIDAFGQLLDLTDTGDEHGFAPLPGQELRPDDPNAAESLGHGTIQLPPRIIQNARLDVQFLPNDGSEGELPTSVLANPVNGWLLPNHLDRSIAVYDEHGAMLGEIVPPAQGDWRPRPRPGGKPHDAIANAVLKRVVAAIIASGDVDSVLEVIDETLWTVDPLGARKDQFLSVLVGRPLAVVQATFVLELMGDPLTDQSWGSTLDLDAQTPAWKRDEGGIRAGAFPIRLGSIALRADGLIGYYQTAGVRAYTTLYAVHVPTGVKAKSIIPIVSGSRYQGDLWLKPATDRVTLTLIIDPRAGVTAWSGILPAATATLPTHLVEDFMGQLRVTFRTGPVVADAQGPRLALPGRKQDAWSWAQGSDAHGWTTTPLQNADDRARLPDAPLALREGWLELTTTDDGEHGP